MKDPPLQANLRELIELPAGAGARCMLSPDTISFHGYVYVDADCYDTVSMMSVAKLLAMAQIMHLEIEHYVAS